MLKSVFALSAFVLLGFAFVSSSARAGVADADLKCESASKRTLLTAHFHDFIGGPVSKAVFTVDGASLEFAQKEGESIADMTARSATLTLPAQKVYTLRLFTPNPASLRTVDEVQLIANPATFKTLQQQGLREHYTFEATAYATDPRPEGRRYGDMTPSIVMSCDLKTDF